MIDCTECGGDGCLYCRQTGRIYISDCPLVFIPAQTWELIEMAEMYLEHGLPPIAGGQLDQAKGFLDAAGYIKKLKGFYKKK